MPIIARSSTAACKANHCLFLFTLFLASFLSVPLLAQEEAEHTDKYVHPHDSVHIRDPHSDRITVGVKGDFTRLNERAGARIVRRQRRRSVVVEPAFDQQSDEKLQKQKGDSAEQQQVKGTWICQGKPCSDFDLQDADSGAAKGLLDDSNSPRAAANHDSVRDNVDEHDRQRPHRKAWWLDEDDGGLVDDHELIERSLDSSLGKKGGIRIPFPVCIWHGWSSWSRHCSIDCTPCSLERCTIDPEASGCKCTGRQSRNRGWTGPCNGHSYESKICESYVCPVHCKFLDWGGWQPCSKSCGRGDKLRYRSKIGPRHKGANECNPHAPTSDLTNCNTFHCPVDCSWRDWADWTPCSLSCGTGRKSRSRSIRAHATHGGVCPGNSTGETICNAFPCPVDCFWKDWQEWTDCPQTCGKDSGKTHKRFRKQDPEAAYGGVPCEGVGEIYKICNDVHCPVHCAWSVWGAWSDCSKPCGELGVQEATRTILIQHEHGGTACVGKRTKTQVCNHRDCPHNCVWGEWEPWSNCTAPCGGGTHTTLRNYLQRGRFGGLDCTGNETSEEVCNAQACPDDKTGASQHKISVFIACFLMISGSVGEVAWP